MAGGTKRTKKFLANDGIKNSIERRNKAKPFKRKQAVAAARADRKEQAKDARAAAPGRDTLTAKQIKPMSVDEFMASGFDEQIDGSEDESDLELDDGVAEDEVGPAVTGEDEEDEEDDSDAEDDDDALEEIGMQGADVDEDDEESDEDEDELDEMEDANAEMGSEISQHKMSLAKLKAQDPEFYKYMQQNDKDTLDFAEDDASEDDEEDVAVAGERFLDEDEQAAEDEELKEADEENTDVGKLLTKAIIAQWAVQLKKFSLSALKKVVRALYETTVAAEKDAELHGVKRYKLASGGAFNSLVKVSLKYVKPLLDHHLPVAHAKTGKGAPLPMTSKGWKKLRAPIKVYLNSVAQLMSQLTDADAQNFVLHYDRALCPYYACFPKLNRLHFKKQLHLWSHASEQVRVAAFMVIRQMCIVSPFPFIEIAMKGMYLTFIRNCKFPTPSVRPTLAFMLNSVIEIYRLDINAAYQHAFVYIRQLAVHLRNAITIKKKDGFLQVYNWQFLYALKVWAKLLADTLENNEDGPLKPLVYPLVQVTLGAIKLIPTARYFPLRFHCLKLLLSLVQKTGVYIPLTGYILETLSFAEMKRKPKPQTGPPLDFQGMLKVPKSKINSALFQDAVVAQVFELSIEFYAAIACTVGFPEITFLDTRRLRAFLKLSKSKSVFAKMKPLLEKLEENGKYVTAQRANVGFSPREKEEIGKWSDALTTKGASPLIRYHKVWKSTEVNRKAMMAAVQDVTGDDYAKQKGKLVPSKKKRKGQPASDDDDDDSDSEAEEDESKKPTKKQKKGKAAAAAEDDEESDLGESDAEISDGGNSDDSDELGDFAMSDFEDDDA